MRSDCAKRDALCCSLGGFIITAGAGMPGRAAGSPGMPLPVDAVAAREVGGEPVADLLVRHSALKGIAVDPEIAPSMIDEFPVLFVAAALAEGVRQAHHRHGGSRRGRRGA